MSKRPLKLPLVWSGDWLADADFFYVACVPSHTMRDAVDGTPKTVPSPAVRELLRVAPEMETLLREIAWVWTTPDGRHGDCGDCGHGVKYCDANAWRCRGRSARALLARLDEARKAGG